MKYERVFTFGCSMTSYAWPTWADMIIHAQGGHGENWGIAGSGNVGILNRLTEASVRHRFTENDLIVIMWTSPLREDRYINGQWSRHGNVYTAPYYDEAFLDKYWDDKGAVIKTMNSISAANRMVPDAAIFAMAPMTELDGFGRQADSEFTEIFNLYKGETARIRGTLFDFMGRRWKNEKVWTKPDKQADYHPLPRDHLRFAERVVAPKVGITITDDTREWVREWQSRVDAASARWETLWGGDATYDPKVAF